MAADPSYIELGVPDVPVARKFYGSLFGWQIADMPGGGYVQTGSLDIGIHGGDNTAHFETFFAVDDLEASLAQVVELGGTAVSEVHDVKDWGRWAECRDNQGVRFGLRQLI